MKTKKKDLVLRIVLLLDLLCVLLVSAFVLYLIWHTNSPVHKRILFPTGTRVLQQEDNHRGFFRRKGIAIVVAQIPSEAVESFGNYLSKVGFWDAQLHDEVQKRLEQIPVSKSTLESDNILWTYRDEAIALIEEPYSDYFAAIYDLETGLLSCIEYDE